MFKTINKFLVVLLLLAAPAFAVDHTFAALDTNNTYTGTNIFNGPVTFAGGFVFAGSGESSIVIADNNSCTAPISGWKLCSINSIPNGWMGNTVLGPFIFGSNVGAPTAGSFIGVAGLDTNGLVPWAQLVTNPGNCNATTFFLGNFTCNGLTPTQITNALQCNDTSGSATVQSCSTSITFTPADKNSIFYETTTANTGDLTVNVNGAGAVHVRKWLGSAILSSGDLPANTTVLLTYYSRGPYWGIETIGNAPTGGGGACASGTTNDFIVYTSPTVCGDSGIPIAGSGTFINVNPGGGTSSTLPSSNHTFVWSFIPSLSLTVTKISYNVLTADNTGNTYDLGVYNASGSLLCHIGATAGTTFAPSLNQFTATFLSSCTLTEHTLYFLAWTGNATTAKLGGGTTQLSLYSLVQPTANSTTTGGALNSSVTLPTAAAGVTVLPSIILN